MVGMGGIMEAGMAIEEESVWKKIGDGIAQYAPALGGILAPFTGGTSAVIGAAVGALGKAFGLGDNPEPEALEKAIAADPQAALKLMLAEQDFKLKQRDQDIAEMKLLLDDVSDARTRQAEHEKITGKTDINLYVLAWTMVLGFLGLTLGLLYFSYQGKPITDQTGVLFMLLGTLASAFGSVIGYFFGSSMGSDAKTKLLTKSAK